MNRTHKIMSLLFVLAMMFSIFSTTFISAAEYEIEKPASDVHDFYRNFTAAIDGKEEQKIKNCEVRRVLCVMEACFKSDELRQTLKVNI